MSFSFLINKNKDENFNKTLFRLINKPGQYTDDTVDEKQLVKRFINSGEEFANQFGLGMILFPSIVRKLGGQAEIKRPNSLEAGLRGADMTSFSNTMSDKRNMLRVKYDCILNLCEESSQLKSPYKAINNQRSKLGREQIWKSPIYNREKRPL